jgi:hypothetical protein
MRSRRWQGPAGWLSGSWLPSCVPSACYRCRDRPVRLPRGAAVQALALAPNDRPEPRAISRPVSAFPIFASVHCFPVGETTRPPFLRQRDASGMSEVTHTSVAPMRSAIQSSAASALSPTRTMLTFDVPGGRIGREPLETTRTLSPKARCHAVDLVAHWACITIDIDVGQLSARLLSGAGFGA